MTHVGTRNENIWPIFPMLNVPERLLVKEKATFQLSHFRQPCPNRHRFFFSFLFSAVGAARLSTVKVPAENLARVIVLYKTSVAPVLQVCAIVMVNAVINVIVNVTINVITNAIIDV